ncbi:MAG: 6-hydroxymethylpterin diphosphokinase MptE-like protein, partial [Chloroflexota bacterium]
RLAKYKDLHKGERCVIIGNGPSLNKTDVSKIKDEYTFGMNRIYLAFPDWGFETSYFTSVNDLVIEQCAADIEKLSMPKFLAWRSHGHLNSIDQTMFLHTTYYNPKFSNDVRRRVWESATVTYVTLQLAYYMGFSEVILIGVDHSFSSKGDPNTTIVSAGDDPDHFNAEYFGKGFRWQLPDLDTSELGYALARQAFEADGRRVIDATIGGKLAIFPKADYDVLFS